MDRYCVIMCGGAGTRFWPFSREARPKQFIDFFGTGQTLLQLAADRVRHFVPDRNIIILTNERYADTVREQLPFISPEHILLEPTRRDTAPAILWVARHIAARHPEASFVTLPSDHVILREAAFHEALRRGFEFVESADRLLAIGVTPTSPNTAYSYIQKGDAFRGSDRISHIKTFADKPDPEMAGIFLRSGEFVWNPGIYMWRAESVIKAFSRYAPEIHDLFEADNDIYLSDREMGYIAEVFPKSCSLPVAYAVMEKADNAYVLETDIGWSDLSTWHALHAMSPKSKEGNVTQNCRTLLYNCSDCLVAAEEDKVVVVSGLKDYIVADTHNALLICPREAEQRIRNVVNDIRARFGDTYV